MQNASDLERTQSWRLLSSAAHCVKKLKWKCAFPTRVPSTRVKSNVCAGFDSDYNEDALEFSTLICFFCFHQLDNMALKNS